MFTVLVDFEIKPDFADQFEKTVIAQANNSLCKETDCLYFDVSRDHANPSIFFLYELYTVEEDFKKHLESEHFLNFDKQISQWVLKKSIRVLTRVGADT